MGKEQRTYEAGMVDQEFLKLVDECRRKQSSQMIHNASYEHAKVLFANLIQEAGDLKEDVIIVSGELHQDFYGSLTEETECALKKGVRVRLAVLSPGADMEQHPFVDLLRRYNATIYTPSNSLSIPHFILVGDKRFRLETDHKQTKAVASFNNQQAGAVLKDIFENCISKNLLKQAA